MTTRGLRMRVCRDGEWCKHREGGESVAFRAGGTRKEWRDFKKERKNEAAEQKFPGQRGCGIIFSERFEMLHCLKLKWMWDRILCNDPEGRRDSGKKDKQETKTNSKTPGKGRRWLTPTPAWETLPASSLGMTAEGNCSRARLLSATPTSVPEALEMHTNPTHTSPRLDHLFSLPGTPTPIRVSKSHRFSVMQSGKPGLSPHHPGMRFGRRDSEARCWIHIQLVYEPGDLGRGHLYFSPPQFLLPMKWGGHSTGAWGLAGRGEGGIKGVTVFTTMRTALA